MTILTMLASLSVARLKPAVQKVSVSLINNPLLQRILLLLTD